MKSEFKVIVAVGGLIGLFAANHFGGLKWVGEQIVSPLQPPATAASQADRIVADFIDTPECNELRAQVLEAGAGSPGSGTTQYAFVTLRQKAAKAGCVSR